MLKRYLRPLSFALVLSLLIWQLTTEAQGVIELDDRLYEIVRLVNIEREKRDIQPLSAENIDLHAAASLRAKEAVESFSHVRPDKSDWITVLEEFDINRSGAAENLGGGKAFSNPARVVKRWMRSTEHKANILNIKYNYIGVGYIEDSSSKFQIYWCLIFANVIPEKTTYDLMHCGE